MITLYLGFIGFLTFITGAGILGCWLRKHPSKDNAEKSSRIMHNLTFFKAKTIKKLTIHLSGQYISSGNRRWSMHHEWRDKSYVSQRR